MKGKVVNLARKFDGQNCSAMTQTDLKDTLKFAEVPEEIVIKSDIHIKQEVLEPLYNDYQYGDYVDHHYVGEENFNWFQESSEQPVIDSEKPLKKKKKRKKELKIKSEGTTIFIQFIQVTQ